MMIMYRYLTHVVCAVFAVAVLSLATGTALAKDSPQHRDNRHRHGMSYPRIGVHIGVLPRHYATIHHRHARYHYYGGVWYSNAGPGFVVVSPPVGVIAPILPPSYTTIWYHGVPYYYGNNTYYVWRAERNGYMVVDPPEELMSQEPIKLSSELYVYPKNGQSEQQRSDDRFACHQWAVGETGYDPSRPPDKMSIVELENKRENYQRATKACLEGKGYSVR